MMAGEKPKEKHALKYGCVLPMSGIERALEQLVEYAHIAEEEGWGGAFLEDYIIFWAHFDPWLTLADLALHTKRVNLVTTVTPFPSFQE